MAGKGSGCGRAPADPAAHLARGYPDAGPQAGRQSTRSDRPTDIDWGAGVRILYLTGKTPLPANSGDALRNWALLQATRTVASRLDLVTLPQPEGPGTAAGLRQVQQLCDAVQVIGRPIRDYLGSPANRLLTLAGRPYYHSVGSARAVRDGVRRMLRATRYDVVVLSQLYLGSALPANVLARTVYDSHNVHHLRLGESLSRTRLPPALQRRILAGIQAQESRLLDRAAVSVACSDPDAAAFAEMAPRARIEVVANGVDLAAGVQAEPPDHGRPLFLASLDARANIEGLAHLVDHVLPLLPADVVIDVAGSNPRPVVGQIVATAGDRANFLGQVPDARETMRRASALLVPLLSGGGTRLKVLEAFAVGLPVVSTAKGVEGIAVSNGEHALVADTPAEFAGALETLLADPHLRDRLVEHARRLAEEHYGWPALGGAFATLVQQVGGQPEEPPRRDAVA